MHRETTTHWLLLGVLLAAGLLRSSLAWSAAEWQSHASIRAAAETAALLAMAGPADVAADNPDPRLRLVQCSQPLTATVPANGVRSARHTAEVRCDGSQPWRLYLPVRVMTTRPVVVASRALARDTVLAPDDVRLANSTPGSVSPGALHEPALAIGRRLRRPAEEGEALVASLLVAPTLVRRGQDVSVEAQAGGLKVRMAGVAKGDGALGDIIDVENGASGRIIQAVVRSAKSVEVLLR
ncbi:MAG: flagellar basal body P-ring formation chaperone FlgA [Gammaproteobacteria bacterium]